MSTQEWRNNNVDKLRKYRREWYERNRRRAKKAIIERKKLVRDLIRKAKDRPCTDCGVKYPYYVMDLDHLDPSKKMATPAHLAAKGWSIERVEEEIAKCDPVCANCHRIRTHGHKNVAKDRSLSLLIPPWT